MQRVASTILSAIAASAISCAPSPQPQGMNVSASDFDLNPLVGVWRGTYTNPAAGRTGTIAFTLRAGESNAVGNVVMIPKPDSLLTPEEREMLSELPPQSRAVLPIHFIRKEGGNVTGTLDPYTSPDCDCIMATTFQGTFTNEATIEGTFTNVPSKAGSSIANGTWKVTRVKKL